MNSYINVTYNIKSKSFRAILTYKYGGVERVIRNRYRLHNFSFFCQYIIINKQSADFKASKI